MENRDIKRIRKFTSNFTDKNINEIFEQRNLKKIGKSYFLTNDTLSSFSGTIGMTPEHEGIFLGREMKESFSPSTSLLDNINKNANMNIAVLNENLEWFFLCGRHVSSKSIFEKYGKDSLILAENKNKECLGYGITDKNGIKPILDKGDFLRRE